MCNQKFHFHVQFIFHLNALHFLCMHMRSNISPERACLSKVMSCQILFKQNFKTFFIHRFTNANNSKTCFKIMAFTTNEKFLDDFFFFFFWNGQIKTCLNFFIFLLLKYFLMSWYRISVSVEQQKAFLMMEMIFSLINTTIQ